MPITIKGILRSLWWSFLPLCFPALYVICAISGRSAKVGEKAAHLAALVCFLYIYSVINSLVAWQILFKPLVSICSSPNWGMCLPGTPWSNVATLWTDAWIRVYAWGERKADEAQCMITAQERRGWTVRQSGGIPLVVTSMGPLATWRVPKPLASVWKWAALPLETGIPLPEDHSSRTFGYKRSEAYE